MTNTTHPTTDTPTHTSEELENQRGHEAYVTKPPRDETYYQRSYPHGEFDAWGGGASGVSM